MALIPGEARALADYLAATATALAVREHTQAEHDEVHTARVGMPLRLSAHMLGCVESKPAQHARAD